jgi:hypothetical protein
LTFSELQELWLGAHPTTGSCFRSREELVAAWAMGRETVMRLWGSHGRRPAGFYEFEWEGSRPPYDRERSTLWRAGVLSEAERLEVETEWRAAFQEAAAADFSVNDGGDEILKGDCARAAHYAHHDIPRELIRRWKKAARRRRAKAAGSPGQPVVGFVEETAAVK